MVTIRNGRHLESYTREGESPVHVIIVIVKSILSRSGHEES